MKKEQRSIGANAHPLRCSMFAYKVMPAALLFSRSLLASSEEHHDLHSDTIRAGAKRGFGHALCNVPLDGPQNRIDILSCVCPATVCFFIMRCASLRSGRRLLFELRPVAVRAQGGPLLVAVLLGRGALIGVAVCRLLQIGRAHV